MTWIPGVPQTVGNKVMAICPKCGKLVRLDKPILGSMHVCAETESAPLPKLD
jgi:hypothetical protein